MHTNLLESQILIVQIACAILQLKGQGGNNIQLIKMAHKNGLSKWPIKMDLQKGP